MRTLRAILIAPSLYNQHGVAIFRLGISPNGALGALTGLSEDYNRRHAGKARIDYEFFDEHVRRAVTPDLLRQWRDDAERQGQRFVVMICGIQTVTYPRARDIALMARAEGIEVLAGGVHLSAHGPSVTFLVSCGVHVAIGEVEPIWDDIIDDALRGQLQTIYRITPEQGLRVKAADSYMVAPDITTVPFPHIPAQWRRHYVNPAQLYIDSSRGCPFLCTFCVVKNVFGRTVRSREPEALVEWMKARVREDGIRSFSFTDDNFLRSPRHIEVLERLAAARAEGLDFSIWLILDVESSCYAYDDSPRGERTRRFLQLCQAAGVGHVYIGLESTNDAVLQDVRKGVNRDREDVHAGPATSESKSPRERLIERYQAAVRAWHDIGTSVECGYILGNEADRPGIARQAVQDLSTIGVDVATFFLLTALPGSEDFARGLRDGKLIGRDFNQYFTHRPTYAHPTFTPAELEYEMRTAVQDFWSWRRLLRRIATGLLGIGRARVATPWIYFKRQMGYKVMLSAGMFSYVEGGLFARRGAWTTPRRATTDEEARQTYLADSPLVTDPSLPSILDDASSMESLPVLSDHLVTERVRLAG